MSEESPPAPAIEIVSGSPTAEELAAVVSVLTAASAAAKGAAAAGDRDGSDRSPARGWNAYWRSVRREHRPGPGAWVGR